MVIQTFDPSTRELKAGRFLNLVYRISFRTIRTTKANPTLKTTTINKIRKQTILKKDEERNFIVSIFFFTCGCHFPNK